MSERLPGLSTKATLFTRGNYFFIVLSSPLAKKDTGYRQLQCVAEEVRYTRDGSQIFALRREAFGDTADQQEDRLVDFAYQAVEEYGIMPDIAIHSADGLILDGLSNSNGSSHD